MLRPGRLPPFFSNLLPEGPLRELLIRRAGIRRLDEFALLRALGEDLPGAVRVADPASAAGGGTSRRVRHGRAGLAVRRFDRQEGGRRVHVEDFAQVFGKFPESKYDGHSYANIAAALASTAANGQEEAMAFVRRAIFSALIGNGDAHLKNWSVVYEDPIHPTLSPAYDLVSTIPYIPRDHLALGFGGSRRFQRFGDRRLQRFAKAARLPFEAVRSECRDTTERTLAAWKKHEGRDMLPRRIAEAISTHIKSVSLDLARTR